MSYNRDDHLEDFDSKKGDIEKGSLAATQSSESSRQLSQIEEGIQRGILQANQHNTSSRSPDNFMQMLQNGGYSVTTGQMDDFDNDALDAYTFDGSTITSANDITHKKFQKQQQVVQFPGQDGQGYPPIKPVPSSGTHSTYSSDKGSRRSEYSAAETFCFGLGKLGVILISVAMTSVAVAVILWLTLGYLPNQGGSSPSSACCKGSFEPAWSGREICNLNDICCVVCASSITEGGDNIVLGATGPDNEEEEAQPETKPTLAPTFQQEETETPPAPEEPKATPAPTSQATLKCCADAWDVWGDYMGRKRCSQDNPDDCCLVCDSSPTTVSPSAVVSPSPTTWPTITASVSPSASPTEGEIKDFFGNDDEVNDNSNGNGNNNGNGNGNGNGNSNAGGNGNSKPVSDTSAPTLPCCEDAWDVWGDYAGRKRCAVENGVDVCCEVC